MIHQPAMDRTALVVVSAEGTPHGYRLDVFNLTEGDGINIWVMEHCTLVTYMYIL